MKNIFLLFFALVFACGSDSAECEPAGTWTITLTLGSGDCLDPGTEGSEQWTVRTAGDDITITDAQGQPADILAYDPADCTAEIEVVFYQAETDLTWEMIGAARLSVSFDGSQANGDGEIVAVLDIAGTDAACSQTVSISGTK